MKRFSVLLAAVIFAAGFGWLLFSQKPTVRAEQEPKKPIEIPLKSIYSTNGQKGLQFLDQGIGDEGFHDVMVKLYQNESCASNIFLAKGDDIGWAVKATWAVFFAGRSVVEPADEILGSKSEKYWLVAYFGTTSS